MQHPLTFITIFVVRLVATLGLCLFFTWGRSLFALWLGSGIILGTMSGILVSPPIDAVLGYLSAMVDAVLLVLSYNSAAARFFRVDGASVQKAT